MSTQHPAQADLYKRVFIFTFSYFYNKRELLWKPPPGDCWRSTSPGKRTRLPNNPSTHEFPNVPCYLQALLLVWAGKRKPPPSCSPLQLSQPPYLPGISAWLSSYAPGRICSSESCFSTIAGKGGNKDSFQNSHGNSSFSLQLHWQPEHCTKQQHTEGICSQVATASIS